MSIIDVWSWFKASSIAFIIASCFLPEAWDSRGRGQLLLYFLYIQTSAIAALLYNAFGSP